MDASPDNLSHLGAELPLMATLEAGSESVSKLLTAAKRRWRSIVICVVFAILLGICFIVQSVTRYTSTASVMIDSKQVGMSASSAFEGMIAFDTGAVDSQVLLLQSDRVAAKVIDHLDLLHNPEFVEPPRSWLNQTIHFAKSKVITIAKRFGLDIRDIPFAQLPLDIQRDVLVQQLEYNLKVTRNARTYVLNIDYTDANPSLARSIAETYATIYLQDGLESRFDVARRAAEWLDERTAEIKSKADRAAAEADKFRASHQLTQASGRLINEQTLTDANTQLSGAMNDLTSTQAKYTRLKQIIDSKDYTGSSLDTLNDPIISNLQAKYLEAYRMNADMSARFGPNHETAVKARKDMGQYSQIIFQELSRILDSYKSEITITSERVASLKETIRNGRSLNDVDADATSKLGLLQQQATAYSTLYLTYLQKAQDLVQQNAIPISDARIITDAQIPIFPSHPKILLILVGSVVGGLGLGAGVAALREYQERSFRTSAQVKNNLGFEFVSYVPKLPDAAFRVNKHADAGENLGLASANIFLSDTKALNTVLNEPLSHFSESLRAVKLALNYRVSGKRPLVLGFVSAFPNEGKSTIAKNFASLLARENDRVLLIDGDLRNPQLTRSLTPHARHGLLDLLVGGENSTEELIHREQGSNLAFLPASARGRVPAIGGMFTSPAMLDLVQKLRGQFDIIIVDFPPMHTLTDASAASSFVDVYQLVVEWGRTSRSAVAAALAANPTIAGKTLGVSLSKVAVEKLKMFDDIGEFDYSNSYDNRYFPLKEKRPA